MKSANVADVVLVSIALCVTVLALAMRVSRIIQMHSSKEERQTLYGDTGIRGQRRMKAAELFLSSMVPFLASAILLVNSGLFFLNRCDSRTRRAGAMFPWLQISFYGWLVAMAGSLRFKGFQKGFGRGTFAILTTIYGIQLGVAVLITVLFIHHWGSSANHLFDDTWGIALFFSFWAVDVVLTFVALWVFARPLRRFLTVRLSMTRSSAEQRTGRYRHTRQEVERLLWRTAVSTVVYAASWLVAGLTYYLHYSGSWDPGQDYKVCSFGSVIVDAAVYLFLACSAGAVTFAHRDDIWLRVGCPRSLSERPLHDFPSGEDNEDDFFDGDHDEEGNEEGRRDPSVVVTEKTHDFDMDKQARDGRKPEDQNRSPSFEITISDAS